MVVQRAGGPHRALPFSSLSLLFFREGALKVGLALEPPHVGLEREEREGEGEGGARGAVRMGTGRRGGRSDRGRISSRALRERPGACCGPHHPYLQAGRPDDDSAAQQEAGAGLHAHDGRGGG